MVGALTKPKSEGKITYSDLYHCYIVIYFDPNSEKNVIEKKDTEQEAQEFLEAQNEQQIQEFWWNRN